MCYFTKQLEIQNKVLSEMGRGMTFWQGKGAYTKENTYVMVTVISKYEVNQLKHIIKGLDPQAFTLFLKVCQWMDTLKRDYRFAVFETNLVFIEI